MASKTDIGGERILWQASRKTVHTYRIAEYSVLQYQRTRFFNYLIVVVVVFFLLFFFFCSLFVCLFVCFFGFGLFVCLFVFIYLFFCLSIFVNFILKKKIIKNKKQAIFIQNPFLNLILLADLSPSAFLMLPWLRVVSCQEYEILI